MEEPHWQAVAGDEEGAGGGLGVGQYLLPHLLLRPVPELHKMHIIRNGRKKS